MPTNITLGSTVVFTVVFFSTATGQSVVSVPSSATLTITYPLANNGIATVTTTVSMAPSGSFFTAAWGSGVAGLGITNYSISAPGQSAPVTGQLRITT